MKLYADKKQKNKSQSVANNVAQKQGVRKPTFQFVDNRPQAIAQRKRQEMVNNSPQVAQAVQLRAMTTKRISQPQQSVFQLAGGANAYSAGDGAYWHVHYDHVKFGGLAATRINFEGRTRNKILRQLRGKRNVPPQSQQGGISYRQCVHWILANR